MPTVTIHTPDKLIVSENGTTAQAESKQSSNQLDKFLIANTSLAIWLVFFAIGGGILALYYARIGYIPDIEWKAALVYLFIGSLVGIAIGLLLTISLFIPGVLWSEFIVFDPGLEFSYEVVGEKLPGGEPARELCIRSIIRNLGLPFLGALLLSHIALVAGKKSYWLFAAIILVATFLTIRKLFKDHPEDRQRFKVCFWFTLSVFLSQISMYVIYWLSGRPADLSLVHDGIGGLSWNQWWNNQLPDFIALTLMCTTGVWITNHIVALRHRYYPRQAIVAALLAAGLTVFTADHFSSLSTKLMGSFGFGHEKVSVVLTERGAGIIKDLRLNTTDPPSKTLDDVVLLSKIGDNYYFKVGDRTFITLQKSEVVSIKKVTSP